MGNPLGRFFGIVILLTGLFAYLAVPAALSILPVSRLGGMFYFFGLSWAGSIFFFAVFTLAAAGAGPVRRTVLVLAGTAFALLNVALAISFLTQGVPFNTAFFTHLDLSTLRIAWATDATRLSAVVLYVLLAPAVVLVCTQGLSRSTAVGWRIRAPVAGLAVLLALLTSYPLQSIVLHHMRTKQSSERMLAEIRSMGIGKLQSAELRDVGRNIVLIYLEGLEQNFFDETLFPDLMPHLGTLREEALWFQNMHQFPGATWTIGGIVASQCGVPLLSEGHGNRILAAVDNPFRQISCLAEIVKTGGYKTVFLGGASLDFAGKGQFLRDNGYDLALGIDELPKASRHKWGMFDSDLYSHATELFDGLVEGESPFLLTLLTLDTHHPEGTPSPGCPLYGTPAQTMLNAVHCADMLAAGFIEHVRTSPAARDTLIAVMSDHLLIDGAPKQVLSSKDRRLTFMILDPDHAPDRYAGAATHFDIAPTVLDAAGFSGAEFSFGHSLLANEEGRAFQRALSDSDFESFRIEALAVESDLREGVAFFPEESRLEIGDARYYARDAINVHYDNPLGRSSEFVALYFESPADHYPLILSDPDEMAHVIGERDSGVVVTASNGGRVCFHEGTCVSERFLGIYDIANESLLKSGSPKDGEILMLEWDEIRLERIPHL